MAPQPSSSAAPKRDATEEDAYVALISGLELGINDAAADFRVGLLAEWLLGESGSEEVRIPAQVRKWHAQEVTNLHRRYNKPDRSRVSYWRVTVCANQTGRK